MTAAAKQIEVEAPVVAIDPARIVMAGVHRNWFTLNLAAGYRYEDLFKPEVWKSVARMSLYHVGDVIEVRRDDLSLWALLMVTEAVAHHARMSVTELFKKDMAPVTFTDDEKSEHEIKYLGLQDGWGILVRSTQRILHKNLKSRDHAREIVNTSLVPHRIDGRPI